MTSVSSYSNVNSTTQVQVTNEDVNSNEDFCDRFLYAIEISRYYIEVKLLLLHSSIHCHREGRIYTIEVLGNGGLLSMGLEQS